jgi:hypothetical protein
MMKKLLLIVLNVAFAFGVFAQNAEKDAARTANPDLSAAQKATLSLMKVYDLSGEQAKATLQIQQAKVQNFADIEPLKASDMAAYAKKRLTALEIAANEFSTLLDPRQLKIFKQERAKQSDDIVRITQNLRKEGLPEAEINKQLGALDF